MGEVAERMCLPAVTQAKLKRPAESLICRDEPSSRTVAPGITAAVESDTMPATTLPVQFCADTLECRRSTANPVAARIFNIGICLIATGSFH